MSYNKAQRMYDNQTPPGWDDEFPTDEQVEEYMDTEEHCEWMMENAGNGDWVEYQEKNFDLICEMAGEWVMRNEPQPPYDTLEE